MASGAKRGGQTFTREQILAALTLNPCHITGEHDPTHTPRYICNFQRSTALDSLLALLGVKIEDVPRALHANCYWCGTKPDQTYPESEDRAACVAWAGA